jgi:hypothetical protein
LVGGAGFQGQSQSQGHGPRCARAVLQRGITVSNASWPGQVHSGGGRTHRDCDECPPQTGRAFSRSLIIIWCPK